MALPSTYSTGTVSIGAGSTTLTGVGTNWLTSGARAGDRVVIAGLSVLIAAVTSATQITLARPWPGAAQTAVNYDIEFRADDQRALTASNQLLQSLTGGTLTSLAALSGGANKLPYFSGPGVMAQTDLTAFARTLLDDATAAAMQSTLGLVPTTTATDSTSGRLLKTGDGGWLGRSDTQNIDLDSEYFGFWGNNSTGTAPLVTPDGVTGSSRWAGLTLGAQNSRLQLAVRTDSAVALYARTRNNSSWTSWRKVYDQSTVLGTVSQSGGVPTGALIERGSNANGDYVRFADGSQTCWTFMAASSAAGVVWTFPAAFGASPIVVGNAVASVMSSVQLEARSATTVTFSARDKTDARRADTIHIQAFGRWF